MRSIFPYTRKVKTALVGGLGDSGGTERERERETKETAKLEDRYMHVPYTLNILWYRKSFCKSCLNSDENASQSIN